MVHSVYFSVFNYFVDYTLYYSVARISNWWILREWVSNCSLNGDGIDVKGDGHQLTDSSGKLQFLQLWDSAESLKFLSHFFETVEELRLRRVTDRENEEKINNLVKEKHQLESCYENALLKVKSVEEELQVKLLDMRKSYESRISDAEEYCARQSLTLEAAEKEVKTLRDDMRNLQFSKYSLEKHNHDQERKIQQQNGSLENSFKQLTELDNRFQRICRKVSTLEEEQGKLTSSVRDVTKVNKDLDEVLRHQKVVLKENRNEIEQLKDNVLKVHTKLQADNWNGNSVRNQMDEVTATLKLELKTHKNTIDTLTEKLTMVEKEYQNSVTLLKESHDLISHHVATNNTLQQNNEILNRSLSEVTEQFTSCQEKYANITKQVETHKAECEQKLQEKSLKIEVLSSQLESALDRCKSLEELNTKWANKNLELIHALSTNAREATQVNTTPQPEDENCAESEISLQLDQISDYISME